MLFEGWGWGWGVGVGGGGEEAWVEGKQSNLRRKDLNTKTGERERIKKIYIKKRGGKGHSFKFFCFLFCFFYCEKKKKKKKKKPKCEAGHVRILCVSLSTHWRWHWHTDTDTLTLTLTQRVQYEFRSRVGNNPADDVTRPRSTWNLRSLYSSPLAQNYEHHGLLPLYCWRHSKWNHKHTNRVSVKVSVLNKPYGFCGR